MMRLRRVYDTAHEEGTPVEQVAVERFGSLEAFEEAKQELQEIVERPEETDHVLRLGLHRLSITDFPHLRALAAVLASYDGAAELDRGLDLLLAGLAETLTHPDGTPRIA